LKEELDSFNYFSDELLDDATSLANLEMALAARKVNEIIRMLTLFSVFFMPLTFIVGIYGMNFKFMPELESQLGYPAVLLFMLVVTATIFFWFRKKNWL
jgi:magnesium transporter